MEWRRGCNIENDKKDNSFSKKKQNDRKEQVNQRKNNYYSDKNNDYKGYRSYNRRSEVVQKKEPNLDDIDSYPVLLSEKDNKLNVNKGKNYLEMCKEKNEEEKEIINLQDKKYWRGHIWIGPKFTKRENSKQVNSYLERINKGHSSTIIIPMTGVKYSRNSVDWYDSWKETFTKGEWMDMSEQIKNEEWEEEVKQLNYNIGKLADRYNKESQEYYDVTGRFDDYAEAVINRIRYEKYLEDLESVEIEEEDDIEEYEEEDYYSDD